MPIGVLRVRPYEFKDAVQQHLLDVRGHSKPKGHFIKLEIRSPLTESGHELRSRMNLYVEKRFFEFNFTVTKVLRPVLVLHYSIQKLQGEFREFYNLRQCGEIRYRSNFRVGSHNKEKGSAKTKRSIILYLLNDICLEEVFNDKVPILVS